MSTLHLTNTTSLAPTSPRSTPSLSPSPSPSPSPLPLPSPSPSPSISQQYHQQHDRINTFASKFSAACTNTPCPTIQSTNLSGATDDELSYLAQNSFGDVLISPNVAAHPPKTEQDRLTFASAIRKALDHVIEKSLTSHSSEHSESHPNQSSIQRKPPSYIDDDDDLAHSSFLDLMGGDSLAHDDCGNKNEDDNQSSRHVQPLSSFNWDSSKSAQVIKQFLKDVSSKPTNSKFTPISENSDVTTDDTDDDDDDDDDDDGDDNTSNNNNDIVIVDPYEFHRLSDSNHNDGLAHSFSSLKSSPSTPSTPTTSTTSTTTTGTTITTSSLSTTPSLSPQTSYERKQQPQSQSSLSSINSPDKKPNTNNNNSQILDIVVLAAQQEAASSAVLRDVRSAHARLRKSTTAFRPGQTPVWAILAQRGGKLKPEAAAEMARARMAAATAAAVMRDAENNNEITTSEPTTPSQKPPPVPLLTASLSAPTFPSKSQQQQQERVTELFDSTDELEPHSDFMNEYVTPTYRALSERASSVFNIRRPKRLSRPASLEVPTPRAKGIEKKSVSFVEGTVFHMKK